MVSNKYRTLKAKSIHLEKSDYEAKKRSMSPTSDASIAPNRTSKTDGAFASFSDDNVPQNNNNVKFGTSTKYSMQESQNNVQNSTTWQKFLEDNYKATGKRTNMSDIRLKSNTPNRTKASQQEVSDFMNDVREKMQSQKVMNPNEISKLTKEQANTIFKLPNKKVSTGEGKSIF